MLYLTGLGTVTPAIADGAIASSTTLSYADLFNSGNLTVNFYDFANLNTGNSGTVGFAGLVPTLAGLYQINVQLPSSGLTAGDNVYVEFVTDAADVLEIQIPYGAGAVTPTDVAAKAANALIRQKAAVSRARALRTARAQMKTTKVRRSRANPDTAPGN